MKLFNFRFEHIAITFYQRDVHTFFQGTAMYATYGNTTGIRRIIQRSNQHLRSTFQLFGSRNIFNNTIQQRGNGICRLLPVCAHPVIFGGTVNNGEVQLVFCCVEAEHQVENHFVNFFRAAVRLIYLIYYHDWFQTDFQCFLKYETCLGHRTFESVD